jgi:adenylate cyclase, class 2
MDSLEIEVKFFLKDLKTAREKILALGARSQGRVFEKNIRFEDRDKSLVAKKSLLRLRRDNLARLTFKSEPKIKDSDFKVYEELEVEVADFNTMERILNALGFFNEQVYEKFRETLTIGSSHLCLDEMPFGNFLEIEGEKTDILQMVEALNLTWSQRILENYLGIFEVLKKRENLPFNDPTFENFKKTPVDFSGHLALFTANNDERSANDR